MRPYGSSTVMFSFFLLAIIVAAAVSTFLPKEYRAFGEDVDDPTNPLLYVGMVLAFTAVILFIARKGWTRVIQGFILFAVGMTMYFVLRALLAHVLDAWVAEFVSIQTAIVLSYALLRWPEWYVVDLTGLLVAAGATAIFGISLGILPAIVLMVTLAVYDAIAVLRTKHMIALADSVIELHLPILLVVPKEQGYSFLDQASIRAEIDEGKEREAMFMGLGDIIIPGVLVVSALNFLTPDRVGDVDVLGIPGYYFVSLFTLVGASLGYWALMWFVWKGRPQPGLPLLNTGAILGYLLSVVAIYGMLGVNWFGTMI